MRPLSVLFTNNTLAARAGSEVYVRDVALALQRRGHRPMAFSLVLGAVAAELRAATIPVVDDLTRITDPPDLIHGHHHVETLIAALMFPDTPIVHFCHGWLPWEELPLRHPSIRRYIAVDEVCRDRLVREEGVPSDAVDVVLNFVDLDRFRPRAPLPRRPIRALVLSNYATGEGYTRAIAQACTAAAITLDIVGLANGNPVSCPEELLGQYDLVFAKARTALEAISVGCAVVLADAVGAGPMVTPENLERLRNRNFGVRELQHPHDVEWYTAQIAAYNAEGAGSVSARVRATAGLEPALDRLLAVYLGALAMPRDEQPGTRAAAQHLQRIATALKQNHRLSLQVAQLSRDLQSARAERDALCHETAVRQQAEERVRDLERVVAELRALPTLRLRDAVLNTPVGPALRAGARKLSRLLD